MGVIGLPHIDKDLETLINLLWQIASYLGVKNLDPIIGTVDGRLIYVDAQAGDDLYDGRSPDPGRPKQTITGAVVIAAPGDIIICYSTGAATFDENTVAGGVVVAADRITIMGLNEIFIVNSNVGATSVFNITGDHCHVLGFHCNEATNTVEGIVSTGNYTTIEDSVFDGAMENGIRLQGVSQCRVERCFIRGCTNDGIELAGVSVENHIENCDIQGVGDNAISLLVGADGNDIRNCVANGLAATTTNGINIAGDQNVVMGCGAGEVSGDNYIDTGANNLWMDNHEDSPVGPTSPDQIYHSENNRVVGVVDMALAATEYDLLNLNFEATDEAIEGGLRIYLAVIGGNYIIHKYMRINGVEREISNEVINCGVSTAVREYNFSHSESVRYTAEGQGAFAPGVGAVHLEYTLGTREP